MPMAFLRAKPIGVMQMIDQGEQDDKVGHLLAQPPASPLEAPLALQTGCTSCSCMLGWRLPTVWGTVGDAVLPCAQVIAVHADDPEFKGFDDIAQLPKHRLAEIRRCAAGVCYEGLHGGPRCPCPTHCPACQQHGWCPGQRGSAICVPATA